MSEIIEPLIQEYLQQMKQELALSPWCVWTDENGIVHAVREAESHIDVIRLSRDSK
jgi:hypothetical protein